MCTQVTLPIDEVFEGKHKKDSLSMASVSFIRYNKTQTSNQFGTPQTLLMVRRSELYRFFNEHRIADNRTSYIASFNSVYNSYDFNNISRMISYCYNEKIQGAKRLGISEEEWMARNPYWNQVVLVPVTTSSTTETSSLGTSSSVLVSVTHDLSLNSIRLVGGNTPIKMQVVYSRFSK